MTAVAVIGGAVVPGTVHLVPGIAAGQQEMSVAGVSPVTTDVSAWSAGGLLTSFLLLAGAAVLRAPLAALALGPAGWAASAVLITVLALRSSC